MLAAISMHALMLLAPACVQDTAQTNRGFCTFEMPSQTLPGTSRHCHVRAGAVSRWMLTASAAGMAWAAIQPCKSSASSFPTMHPCLKVTQLCNTRLVCLVYKVFLPCVVASGGRYIYWAPCPFSVGSCMDLASPTRFRTCGALHLQLVCRRTLPLGRISLLWIITCCFREFG